MDRSAGRGFEVVEGMSKKEKKENSWTQTTMVISGRRIEVEKGIGGISGNGKK